MLIRFYNYFLFISLIINLSFTQDDIENVIKYDLKFKRSSVHAGEVVTLVANLNLLENFYIYSSNPNNSLSPSYIEWEDSSFFSIVGILKEPKPKIKYELPSL